MGTSSQELMRLLLMHFKNMFQGDGCPHPAPSRPRGRAGKTRSGGTSRHQNHLGAATGLLFTSLTVMRFTHSRRLTRENSSEFMRAHTLTFDIVCPRVKRF